MLPRLRSKAPEFSGMAVVNNKCKKINLSDYKGKYVLLLFYPFDFTSLSQSEILAFSNRADEFREIGCEIIACSTDSVFSHAEWIKLLRKKNVGSINIPLLSDKSAQIGFRYGILTYNVRVPFRGTFIIDQIQNLRHMTVNDLSIGRSVDESLHVVQEMQYIDEHGEACPADWKPGGETTIPEQEKPKDYSEYLWFRRNKRNK